jgi:RNA polymerase sigma-70 factor (ECF subfamily)
MESKTDDLGSPPRLFATTHWSVVGKAGNRDEQSLNTLCETYRDPLLAYLRYIGKDHETASDLVQGFFEHLLKHDFLEGVSPEKGRFRTFLIASLKHYLCDQYDRQSAAKRGGGVQPASLDAADGASHPALQVTDPCNGPDRAFDRAWAETVFTHSLARLRQECVMAGRGELFAAVEPLMHQDEDAPSYRETASQLGMSDGALRLAAKRLRDRLRHLIREEIRQTVADERQWESELRYLVELFSR